ncbi:hypothetical protein MASR2M117_20060 [Paludibacter sp.]
MKTNIIKTSILFLTVLLVSCQTKDWMPEVTQVAFPKLTLTATSDLLIQGGSLNGQFDVDMFYDNDKPKDARLVVAMNGDYTNIKVLKASLTTFPSRENITDAKLVELFGLTAINPGDKFEIGLDVKEEGGIWYPAFNKYGVAYGSGPMALSGASPIITFKAVCAFDINDFVGPATINDPWWYEGTYNATIVKESDTSIRIKNYSELAGDLVVVINPANHTVSVAKQAFDVNLAGFGMPQYTNPSAAGKGDLDACNKKITLVLTYTVDQGSFGTASPLTISF